MRLAGPPSAYCRWLCVVLSMLQGHARHCGDERANVAAIAESVARALVHAHCRTAHWHSFTYFALSATLTGVLAVVSCARRTTTRTLSGLVKFWMSRAAGDFLLRPDNSILHASITFTPRYPPPLRRHLRIQARQCTRSFASHYCFFLSPDRHVTRSRTTMQG